LKFLCYTRVVFREYQHATDPKSHGL
jgi:hypothetical protein